MGPSQIATGFGLGLYKRPVPQRSEALSGSPRRWLPCVADVCAVYPIAVLSQNPSAAVGQVSADGQFRWDGQQWVPIPRGAREPTPWTRPMQLATAGFFAVQALLSILTSAVYINHDNMLRVMQAQGSLPQGTDP